MTLRLSLSTGTLAHLPLHHVFRVAQEAGFDGVELVYTPISAQLDAKRILQLSRLYRLSILSVHPSVIPYPGYDRAARILPPLVDLAQRVGCPLVVVHTPKVESLNEPGGKDFVEVVIRETARSKPNVRVTVENAGFYRPADARFWLHDVRNLHTLADQHDLLLTFDTSHAGTSPFGVQESFSLLRDRVVNVHFSDLIPRRLKPDWRPLHTMLSHHQMPGEGILPLTRFVRTLLADGYIGPLTFELSPTAVRAWSIAQTRKRFRQAIEFVRQLEPD